MKKTLLFLGVASMLAVTPAFAATTHKMPVPAKHAAAMCTIHGKKQACPKHVSHKVVKKHHTLALIKKPAKSY